MRLLDLMHRARVDFYMTPEERSAFRSYVIGAAGHYLSETEATSVVETAIELVTKTREGKEKEAANG